MRKTTVSLLIVLAITVLSSVPALAQEEERGKARRENRPMLENLLKRAERPAVRPELKNMIERLEKKFELYYNRLSRLLARIQKRIDTLSSQGDNVEAPQAKLNEAKAKLEVAKILSEQALSALKSADTQEERQDARELVKKAKTAFRETMQTAMQAVRLLKGLRR